MLFLSLFLAGFTLGVFATLKIFSPEAQEEGWDPQHFPIADKINSNKSLLPKAKPLPILPKSKLPNPLTSSSSN